MKTKATEGKIRRAARTITPCLHNDETTEGMNRGIRRAVAAIKKRKPGSGKDDVIHYGKHI